MIASDVLKAPFPWAGGKSRVAHIVWPRFGNVVNYVEPFAGSLAMLLARPFPPRTETVNDADAFLANFWRSVQADPDTVAYYADSPVNEADLHGRHRWLVNAIPQPQVIPPEFDTPELQAAYLAGWQASYNPHDPHAMRERLMTDPHYYDAKVAGWWVWGLSAWIGGGWCALNYGNKSGITKNGQSTEERRPALTNVNECGVSPITRNGRTRPPYFALTHSGGYGRAG
ncbi:MAG: DNA adenine methylase [Anaerolineae bacterium]|nr:DNA adenine methylase [Anaerolineae bacterium]